MTLTASTMLALGIEAPDFHLPDTHSKIWSLQDFQGAKGLLIMFICNHCPFVRHIQSTLLPICAEYQQKGIAMAAINSNEFFSNPEDDPAHMADQATQAGFTFPYLLDETQSVAKAYHAACTPDFFLFDGQLKLVYRGQFDDSRPGKNIPVTGRDLRTAMDSVIAYRPIATVQKPSIGCNIKWKAGNEPDYYAT